MKRLIMIIAAISLTIATTSYSLASGDYAAGQAKSVICSACHGVDGNSSNPEYPSIAGQVPGYIAKQLEKFKLGSRKNTIMAGMALALTKEDMEDLDAWYSLQKPVIHTIEVDELEIAELGEQLYRGGYPPMKVPACMGCHGPNGAGIPTNFPRLGGQHAKYTESQLLAFKSKERESDIMGPIAFGMTLEQIRAISLYLSALH